MIKVNEKLSFYLNLVKPVEGTNKVKISSFRQPCFDKTDHEVVKQLISEQTATKSKNE